MSPRMWFTLVLRYLGVSEILSGLDHFVTAFNVHVGLFPSSTTTLAFINHGVKNAIVGAILLLGAAQISALLVSALPTKLSEPGNGESANV